MTWNRAIKIKRSQQRSVALTRDHTVYSTTLFFYVCKEGDIVFCVNDSFCQSKPLYGCLFRFTLRIKCMFSVGILILCILFFVLIIKKICCFLCEKRNFFKVKNCKNNKKKNLIYTNADNSNPHVKFFFFLASKNISDP